MLVSDIKTVGKATHIISAVYFPIRGEAELSWCDIKSGEEAHLTVPVTLAEGKALAKTVPPCVYHEAHSKLDIDTKEER